MTVRATWLPPALDHLAPLDQTYRHLAVDRVLCASRQYKAELHIHETGFVTCYPDLCEGWIDV
ncbi:putative glycolipid-binding domain-containing protein [Ruegeria sp. 2205SS24-7]|uniref:putative glycolipid-binding domain-containing protein n=1 Tax=Ruegeria discodermiae TaxID=3064389 RepID=UPI0027424D15|nr:putative glycolipid-binding domain-containing protein [Ruegeria sp. 2205SS24-7]MDP5220661.1 putative glycolipid-binding domain-containing protein [Ruegeria sp. 2205SS24-7]